MKNTFCVVYITAPAGSPAQKIAMSLLKKRLAACVNIVPSVQSSYWWKGKIEFSGEALLIIKTKTSLLTKLIPVVQKIHPYTVPEIIAVPLIGGYKPYLAWLKSETKA